MIRMTRGLSVVAFFGFVTILRTAAPAYGSGFGVFTQGASALGQADAVVAHGDGPSAIFFNPALITRLPGTQVEIGTTMLFPSRDFKSSSAGATSSTEDTVYFPSTFYISHAFNDKISAGLGVFNPFGLGTEWNGDWEGRYIATRSEIETYNFNPVLAYRITPDLSIAGGLDVVYLDATLENKVNLTLLGEPDNVNQKLKGDGTGVGYNLAVAYNAGHGISLGASYRSEVEIDVKGTVRLDPSSSVIPNTGAKTTLTLPQQLMAGVAYQANDKLIVEAGFRWEDWRSYKESKIELDQAPFGQPQGTPKNWRETFAVNAGGSYRLNDTVTLLAGYLYGWNAVPDDTFEPSVPDSDTHLFCVGTDMAFNSFTLAVSYGYQLQEERRKNNAVGAAVGGTANGDYNADIHLLGLSATYRF